MDDDRETEVGRQPLGDRAPRFAVVIAAEDADARPRPAGSAPFGPAAVVLHVEPAGRVLVPGDLVHALAELGIGIRPEAAPDPFVPRLQALAALLRRLV